MKNLFYIFTLITLLFVTSCKSKVAVDKKSTIDSTLVTITPEEPKDANKPVIDKLEFYQNVILPPKFEQVKINSKLNIEDANNTLPTLDAVFYIENNQKVWVNISFWMMPQVRGIATPEGVKGYFKLEKKYIDSNYDYLNNLLNVNFLDYATFQKILLGRTFIKINDSNFILSRNAQGFNLDSAGTHVMETEDGSREYKIEIRYTPTFDLKKIYLKDVNTTDELEILYDDWLEHEGLKLPKYVKIIIKGTKNNQILIENTKFDFSKMETPYTVPNRYQKIEIQ